MMTYREAAEYLGNYFEHTCWRGPNDPLHEASDMAIKVLYMMDNITEELIKSYTYGGSEQAIVYSEDNPDGKLIDI